MRFLGLALGLVILVVGGSAVVWPDLLAVPGFAQTDEIEGSWTAQDCGEFSTWPSVPSNPSAAGNEFEGKDVGSVQVSGLGTQELSLAVGNSYPSHGVLCELTWVNSGTLIARAQTVELSPGTGLTDCDVSGDSLRCTEVTVEFETDAGACVEPDTEQSLTLVTHTEQAASENALYEFKLEVVVVQCEEPLIIETPPPTPTLVSTVLAAVRTPTPVQEVLGVQQLPPTGFGLADEGGTDWRVSGALLVLGSSLIVASLWAMRRARPAAVPLAVRDDEGRSES